MRHGASTHSFLYQAFCYVLLASPPTGLVADDLTEVARSFLYTNREDAISILERAVRESPNRTDYWVEYIRAISIDGENQYVADCVSRAALAIHPRSPALWQARMALFPASVALDLLPTLEKMPGYEAQARDAREMLELALKVPFTWDDPVFRGGWSAELINVGHWDRADAVSRRGLELVPRDRYLHACRAMVLAHQRDFEG